MTFLSSPLNRVLILIALFAIIGLFAYFSIVQPAVQQYNESQARLIQDQQTYSDLKRVADQKPQYLALTKQIQQRLGNVELTADPRVYIPSYLKQIENLAKQDGLQVTAVTPQAVPVPSPGASTAPATGAQATANAIPAIGAAARAAGASNAQTGVTNAAAQAPGATPVPGPAGAAQPVVPGSSTVTGPPGSPSARANAIAYLNQSFTQVPINMELSGTYSKLEKFLRDLNKFPKLIGVGNLSMTPSTGQPVGETPTLTVVLPIVAYRLSPSGAGPQAVPTAAPATGSRNGG
jgi:Tfp pilus assembly protein PilO